MAAGPRKAVQAADAGALLSANSDLLSALDPPPLPNPRPCELRQPSGPGGPPRSTLRREWLLLWLSVMLLIAIVAPPLVNLSRYQHRIVDTMSLSLGREVVLRSVALRLLPVPALVLHDVVINEEPGFGAEPALRAPSVIAQLRITSLWRGRLEISRVEMSDASLNLVRDQRGRWNVGSLLLQASHVANAPTAQRRVGKQPRFPYIEITDSRVNVKQGVEKLPYSLQNANLSMWLAEPEIWQLRLDGQPIRTDIELGLSDTGILRVEGRLHRATVLGHMPLALHGDWANAPLGQASRLLLGTDRGWRGDLHASADVSGDLDNLAITARVFVPNLHREEFTPVEPFAVDATCRATYRRTAGTLSDLGCRWPVGSGQLLLTGSIVTSGVSPNPQAQLTPNQEPSSRSALALNVQQLPASFLLAAIGLARSDFVPAFRLEGALSGMLFYNTPGGGVPPYTGVLEAPLLRLVAPGLHEPLSWRDTRLAASTPAGGGIPTLVLTAAPVDVGGPAPTVIDAQLNVEGFLIRANGSASVARVEELGRAAHLLPTALAWLAPRGTVEFDVTRSGGWQPPSNAIPASTAAHPAFAGAAASQSRSPSVIAAGSSATSGWLRLRNASYAPRFLPEVVVLPLAQATFSPGQIAWNVPAALFHQTTLQFSATYPLACRETCVTRFRASSPSLDGGALASAVRGGEAEGHPLSAWLNRADPNAAAWPALEGTVHAETLILGRLTLRNAEAALSVADGQASLRSLDALALGGALHGEGSMKMANGEPQYVLNTAFTRVTAAATGALFHENWGSGMLTLSSSLRLRGSDGAQISRSAEGEFHAEWTHGALGSETPLARFSLWAGDGRVEHQSLVFAHGQLSPTPSGKPIPVTGTISFSRALVLHIGEVPNVAGAERSDNQVTVTGTLTHPSD